MKKKIIGVIIAISLIIATVPTIVFANGSQNTSPIKLRTAPSEHEIGDWNVEWSESFEQGIPSTWQNIDKDGDGYKWWKMKEDAGFDLPFLSHHGEQSIHSNSFIRQGRKILEPDNWLVLPEQNLNAEKNYALTFDVMSPDKSYLKDKIGIYISTDDGNSYNRLGDDFDLTKCTVDNHSCSDWLEVEVDLSAYSGKKVSIAIVHHNSRDEYIVVMDCMYMWSKNKHKHCVCGNDTSFNGHDTHTIVEWTEWNSTDSLPTTSGNYYLKNDITLATEQIINSGINICLNGKTIKSNTSDYAITVKKNATLTITDCIDNGKLECSIENYGSFSLYNCNIIGGIFKGDIENNGTIIGGTFYGNVTGNGTIADSAKVEVTLDLDDGNGNDKQYVLKGQKLTLPTPTKDGYTFDGWFNGENEYDFNSPVLSPLSLTAHWVKIATPPATEPPTTKPSTTQPTTATTTESTTVTQATEPTTETTTTAQTESATDKISAKTVNSVADYNETTKGLAKKNTSKTSPNTGNKAALVTSTALATVLAIAFVITKKKKDN